MTTRCFWLEPTLRTKFHLSRDTYTGPNKAQRCPLRPEWPHSARGPVEIIQVPLGGDDDSRWPSICDCGYVFGPDDGHGSTSERIYVRTDTGTETTLREAGPGAMWDATWYEWMTPGPDGRHLCVETPGGTWHVDGQASNCTMPDDGKQRRHHCWTRHGDPTSVPPTVTVDKTSGPTCAAGGGSIQCGSYHGFLHEGVLDP